MWILMHDDGRLSSSGSSGYLDVSEIEDDDFMAGGQTWC